MDIEKYGRLKQFANVLEELIDGWEALIKKTEAGEFDQLAEGIGSLPKKPAKIYRNPVIVAKEYKAIIDAGKAKNQSDLARILGVSRVRICQVLSLLKMDKKKII